MFLDPQPSSSRPESRRCVGLLCVLDTPRASNSTWVPRCPLMPMPKSSRPPDTWSTLATSFASITGWYSGTITMPVMMRMLWVAPGRGSHCRQVQHRRARRVAVHDVLAHGYALEAQFFGAPRELGYVPVVLHAQAAPESDVAAAHAAVPLFSVCSVAPNSTTEEEAAIKSRI